MFFEEVHEQHKSSPTTQQTTNLFTSFTACRRCRKTACPVAFNVLVSIKTHSLLCPHPQLLLILIHLLFVDGCENGKSENAAEFQETKPPSGDYDLNIALVGVVL